MDNKLPLNCILSFCRDRIAEHGEDSFCYAFCDTAGLVAVFDGCGGAGAQKHACYKGHSEAYVASRLCADAVFEEFCEVFPTDMSADRFARERLAPVMKQVLEEHAPVSEEGAMKIRGSMIRTLPTTAAMAIIRRADEDALQVSAVWAGDSRVYLLDADGLAQLMVDDTNVPDPMESLYEDGILKNVVCKDRPVRLNCLEYRVKLPFMVFAVSDGCFGYVSTPMEFEAMLLSTLLESDCLIKWEENLAHTIGAVAGDDHTLCLAAYGYKSADQIRKSLGARYAVLKKDYLQPLVGSDPDDRQLRRELWEKYAPNYCRYLKEGIQNGDAG